MGSQERADLVALVRPRVEEIIRRIAEECARAASGGALDRALADSLTAAMLELAPAWVDALEASDAERADRLLLLQGRGLGPRFRAVPPLARVGAVSYGLRITRAAVVEVCAAAGRPAAPLIEELDLFEHALGGIRDEGLRDTGIA